LDIHVLQELVVHLVSPSSHTNRCILPPSF